ncbi:MAG: hypothetical protein ABIR96_02255 [Bdellovibrionota bacterium]
MKTRIASKIAILGCALLLALSVFAQDLDSELELKPRARWVLEQGFAPQLLDCRLSDKSNLQCVASDNLLSVTCEATHFGRRAEVKATFKGRAFSCEGTRFDKQSLMSQWKIILKSESGSESVWVADAADMDQLERLYKTEMKSSPLLDRSERPFWSADFANRSNRMGSESLRLVGTQLRWGRDRWILGADIYQALGRENADIKNFLRLSGSFSLGSGEAGRGWVFQVDSGHDFLSNGLRATSHCLGPQYLLNPGSWRFSLGGGNCWVQSSQITLAPFAMVGMKRKIYGPVFLTLDASARYLTGSYGAHDVSGLETRTQLGVSVAIAPR